MTVFEQLSNNKGTVSSALGKALAQIVLEENQINILSECIDLVAYEASTPVSKHIRAGAAKVVEIVAERKPELVAPHLQRLFPALSVKEPQTRWMIIRVMGFCAHLNHDVARQATVHAEKYIDAKEGLCIASSADLFLGDLGVLSKKDALEVSPLLERSMETVITNEQDWLLVAFSKMFTSLESAQQDRVLKFAERWRCSSRKSTQRRAEKIPKPRQRKV